MLSPYLLSLSRYSQGTLPDTTQIPISLQVLFETSFCCVVFALGFDVLYVVDGVDVVLLVVAVVFVVVDFGLVTSVVITDVVINGVTVVLAAVTIFNADEVVTASAFIVLSGDESALGSRVFWVTRTVLSISVGWVGSATGTFTSAVPVSEYLTVTKAGRVFPLRRTSGGSVKNCCTVCSWFGR